MQNYLPFIELSNKSACAFFNGLAVLSISIYVWFKYIFHFNLWY